MLVYKKKTTPQKVENICYITHKYLEGFKVLKAFLLLDLYYI